MLAYFASLIDAVNFAHSKSIGEYKLPDMQLLALNIDRKVYMKFCQGIKK